MKTIKVSVRTNVKGSLCESFFEVKNTASDKEIQIKAQQAVEDMSEWWWEEVDN